MKLTRSSLAIALGLSLSFLAFLTLSVATVSAQDSKIALQRGYRTGYSDGYMAGYRDSIDNASSNFERHSDYIEARRAYNQDYGSLDDYRDGYRQGFEAGYGTGFAKRSFEATVPSDLNRRGLTAVRSETSSAEVKTESEISSVPEPMTARPDPIAVETAPEVVEEAVIPGLESTSPEPVVEKQIRQEIIQKASYRKDEDPIIIIPRDTELILELQDDINTESNRDGDRFTARVVSPSEIDGAIIEGRIGRIQKPGRLKRRSELQLSFDRIVLSEERWSNFDAVMTEVMPVSGDNVKTVDDEGTAIGKSSVKTDTIRIGAATGAGLGIGAITAGPVGAAIGAGVGAAYGVGASVVERGKHIRLNRNQQIRIRVSYETKIR
jgi:hypothetical protein